MYVNVDMPAYAALQDAALRGDNFKVEVLLESYCKQFGGDFDPRMYHFEVTEIRIISGGSDGCKTQQAQRVDPEVHPGGAPGADEGLPSGVRE